MTDRCRRSSRGASRSSSGRAPCRWTSWIFRCNVGLGPALDAGPGGVPARRRRPDGRRRHQPAAPVRRAAADHRVRRGPVGSGLLEFGADADDIVGSRTPPVDPADIRARSRFADPFNHPTVVYRRELRAGRRRLHRLRADGGLPALGEDDRRGRAGGQRGRAAGQVPGGRGGVRASRRVGPAARRAGRAAPVPRGSGSPPAPSSCATCSCAAGTGWCRNGCGACAYRRVIAGYGGSLHLNGRHHPACRNAPGMEACPLDQSGVP